MAPRPKFSRTAPREPLDVPTPLDVACTRDRRWQRDNDGPRPRLCIVADGNGIDLLDALSVGFVEPLGVLYELLLSRRGAHLEGRYQSPEPLARWEALHLLRKYEAFFSGDGRHNVWLAETQGEGLLVYDQHELVFAYGDIDRYEQALRDLGYERGDPELPVPHAHAYNQEFDADEDRLLAEFEWVLFPQEERGG